MWLYERALKEECGYTGYQPYEASALLLSSTDLIILAGTGNGLLTLETTDPTSRNHPCSMVRHTPYQETVPRLSLATKPISVEPVLPHSIFLPELEAGVSRPGHLLI